MSNDEQSGLDLAWTFGFSSWITNSVHDLHPSRPNCLVCVAGLHAVIYNYVAGQQQLLIGHTSSIGAIATSPNRSLIVTAESQGHPDSLVIVWESQSGLPLATRQLEQGIASICTSPNGASIALLTCDMQCVLIWTWAQDVLLQVELSPSPSPWFQICWNPTANDVCITSDQSVTFVHFDQDQQGALTTGRSDLCLLPNSGYIGTRAYGKLQYSVHVPNSNEVLSGTDTGTIVVWSQHFSESHRTFMKAVPLGSSSSITFVDVVNQLIVVASKDQALRFLDLQFRIVFWFEDFAYGPINSLSFAMSAAMAAIVQAGVTINIPEFILATSQANIVKLTAKSIQALPNPNVPRGFLLVKGFADEIACIASHPSEPVFATGTKSGSFQLIDYVDRTIQFAKQFSAGLQISTMAFSYKPENRMLAIALTSNTEHGQIQICSLPNRLSILDSVEAKGSMNLLSFSWCDSYLALASSELIPGGQDLRHFLYLYEKCRTDQKWAYMGRVEAHSREIIQIEFDRYHMQLGRCTRLLSLSSDRTLAFIDLFNSSMAGGVCVKRTTILRMDMPARPISMYLHLENSNSMLSVSDSQGKVRTFVERESDGDWICIRTGQGPVNDQYFAQRLVPLPSSNEVLAYTSAERFLGLLRFPVIFNENTAVIGHAGRIDQVVAGYDGTTLLSCDSRHRGIHLWKIDQDRFRVAIRSSNSVSYLAQDLDRIRHIVSYAALKDGGRTRDSASDTLEMKQVVNVMRSLGCYLSQENIKEIHTELRWRLDASQSSIQDLDQIPDGSISLPNLIDLLLNHRPINPDSDTNSITKAFRMLGADYHGNLSLDGLLSKLEHHGEMMSKAEFQECCRLINPDHELTSIQTVITPKIFIEKILNLKQNANTIT